MAAFVNSVERVSATLRTGNPTRATVNLTKNQNLSKCAVLSVSGRYGGSQSTLTGDGISNFLNAAEVLDNAGTPAVRFSRASSQNISNDFIIEASVVEFNSRVTVQSGQVSTSDIAVTVDITPVNQSNSFIVFNSYSSSTTNDDLGRMYVRASFLSDSQIEFRRNIGSFPTHTIYWWVVEGNGTDFQTEYATGSASLTARDGTISLSNAVNLSHSFIIPTYQTSEASDDIRDGVFNFSLTGTNTLSWYRDHGGTPSATATLGCFVVRSDSAGLATQRLSFDVDVNAPVNQSISAVDLDRAVIMSGHHSGPGDWPPSNTTAGNNNPRTISTLAFTSSTNVQVNRATQGALPFNAGDMRCEVVEFELTPSGPFPQTIPVSLIEETDTVLPVEAITSQTVLVGLVSETDTVLEVTPQVGGPVQSIPVDLIQETDTVFAVTPIAPAPPQSVVVDLITEVDSVQAVTPVVGEVTVPVGIVSETDEVFPVAPVPGAVSVSVDIVSELDQVAPVFPLIEGGPQTVLVVNVAERDFVFPVTPRIGPEEEELKGGIPPIRRRRKRRRYILPDGRVYTDPERALYELRALLKAERDAEESGGEAAISEPTPASLAQEISPPDTAPDEPVTPQMLQSAVSELPELMLARPENVPSLDPQLISVLFQMIDDEEAAMLLL